MAIDCSQVKADLTTLLHATGDNDLVWWSGDELYDAIDSAAQSLAESTQLLGASYLQGLQDQVGAYIVGLRPLACRAVIADGRAIVESPVEDLEALNPNWREWEDTVPERFALDAEQRGTLRVVPKASSASTGKVLQTLYRQAPPEINSGATALDYPGALSECLLWSALAGVLSKEGKGARPEMVQACQGMADLMTAAAKEYYGVRKT